MTTWRLSLAAQDDIARILVRSREAFGEQAQARYAELIASGLRAIAGAEAGFAGTARPELGDGVRTWHLRPVSAATAHGRVRKPRHFIVYRMEGDVVVVGRVLHDAMELREHVAADDWD
jgi:toxin ParE1/3/4